MGEMKKGYLLPISVIIIFLFLLSGCERVTVITNPFIGKWKSGLFIFTFNTDKTFVFEIGSALSFKMVGTYEYDDDKIDLKFGDETKTTFRYKFNENKDNMFLTPKTEFKWFKTTIKFKKEDKKE